MKNSIFEITENTRNRTFKATVEDIPVGDSVMRTTCTVEKTTSESGEVKTIKTRKIVEYEPGDEIPDQERAIAAYFAPVYAPVQTGEARLPDDNLQKVKLSAESVVKIITDEFDSAIAAALASDPAQPETPEEECGAAECGIAECKADRFDSAIDAALNSVETDSPPELEESELRSVILAGDLREEPTVEPVQPPTVQTQAAQVQAVQADSAVEPSAEAKPEKKRFSLADIPDPKQAAYDEAVKELRRQREARDAEREDEAVKRASEVLNSAFSKPQAEPPAAVKHAPTDAEVMDGLEP